MTPDQQRAAADYLAERYGASQRRVCGAMGRARSTVRYRRKARPDEPAMTREIKRLARRHPRYGYRRIRAMLIRRGWTVNLKRVRRLWIELGLKRPVRPRIGTAALEVECPQPAPLDPFPQPALPFLESPERKGQPSSS